MYLLFLPLKSPVILVISAIFFITASITTLDKKAMQARWSGAFGDKRPVLMVWVLAFVFIEKTAIITLFVLNWRYALMLYVLVFLLALSPVLETIGSIILHLVGVIHKVRKCTVKP